MRLYGNNEPQSVSPLLEGHRGAMASPNYCNDLNCWCHTSSEYHHRTTSLPMEASGDTVYQSLRWLLGQTQTRDAVVEDEVDNWLGSPDEYDALALPDLDDECNPLPYERRESVQSRDGGMI